jgi:hypothetical protein
MTPTRSTTASKLPGDFVSLDLLSRIKKLEMNVSKLRRQLMNRGTNQNGADGRDGAPGVDGSDGRDGAPGVNGADGRDGAPGVDGADCTFIVDSRYGNADQAYNAATTNRNVNVSTSTVYLPQYDAPSQRILVRVTGPTNGLFPFVFSMKRRNTFTPLKIFISSQLGFLSSSRPNFALEHQDVRVPSAATPESLGYGQAAFREMSLSYICE